MDKNSNDIENNSVTVQIYSVKPLELEQLCFLDSNSFKSLQIFNEVDYTYAYRQTNRTNLNNIPNSQNITLYSLFLSKMHTKVGIGKLRSFLMKPTRNMSILKERHKIVEFFRDSHNHELTDMVRVALKKCKFVTTIFRRMKETRCVVNEWKRVYKTSQSLIAICNLAIPLNKKVNSRISNIDSVSSQKTQSHISTETNRINSRSSRSLNDASASQVSSFYSVQMNDVKQNLFKRIYSCNYGPKFEYLIRLFENTINLKESIQVSHK